MPVKAASSRKIRSSGEEKSAMTSMFAAPFGTVEKLK
jgi:hypothetical protein